MYVDEDGEFWNLVAGFFIGGIIGTTVSVVSQLIFTGEVDLMQTGIAFVSGGVSGLIVSSCVGLIGGPGLKNASNPLAQLDINLSVLKSMNSANLSREYANIISDLLTTASSVAGKEVGKATVVAAVTSFGKDFLNGTYKIIFD